MAENKNWHRADYPEMAYLSWKKKRQDKDEQNYQDGETVKNEVKESKDEKSYRATEFLQPREISLSPGVRRKEFGVVNSILRVFY